MSSANLAQKFARYLQKRKAFQVQDHSCGWRVISLHYQHVSAKTQSIIFFRNWVDASRYGIRSLRLRNSVPYCRIIVLCIDSISVKWNFITPLPFLCPNFSFNLMLLKYLDRIEKYPKETEWRMKCSILSSLINYHRLKIFFVVRLVSVRVVLPAWSRANG